MPEIHAARRRRAQEKIAEAGADAALITSGPNVRYLTGLASSNAALLLTADGAAVLATDSRYALAAQRDCPDLELITERFIEPRLATEMASRGLGTVAFEAHEMTVERHAELVARAGGVKVVPFGRKIEELRAVKDPSEIELLGTACRISCQAIADVFSLIRPGMTERGLPATRCGARGTATTPSTGWGMASASRCTKRRASGTAERVNSQAGFRSPSSQVSTCPAGVVSG